LNLIHEFAIEPSALASKQNARYLLDGMGISKGRVISRFPKKWFRLVMAACKDCADVEKKYIESRLAELAKGNTEQKVLRFARECLNPDREWIDNALGSHMSKPFRAIITKTLAIEEVGLIAGELDERESKWSVDTQQQIPYTAKDMAIASSVLLAHSSEIIFVDPYFCFDQQHLKPLNEFLKFVPMEKVERIEYHYAQKNKLDRQQLKQLRNNNWSKYVDCNGDGKIEFYRWSEKSGGAGEKFHARYILTDIGGITYDHGLGVSSETGTMNVSILDYNLYKERWEQFSDLERMKCCFDYVDQLSSP